MLFVWKNEAWNIHYPWLSLDFYILSESSSSAQSMALMVLSQKKVLKISADQSLWGGNQIHFGTDGLKSLPAHRSSVVGKSLAQWYIQHHRKYAGLRENFAFISQLCNSRLLIHFLITVPHTSSICTGFASEFLLLLCAPKHCSSLSISLLPGSH